ncbi:MAG: hypothetical protein V4687_16170 [Bacteroidota bacterium]
MISVFDHTIFECHDILKDKLNAVPSDILYDKHYAIFFIEEIEMVVRVDDGLFLIEMRIKDLASFHYRHYMSHPLNCQAIQLLQKMILRLRNKAQSRRKDQNIEAMAKLLDSGNTANWKRFVPYPEIL